MLKPTHSTLPDQTMSLKIQELNITLFAKDLKPGTIHPAVLQYLGIIPAQWELTENPVYSERELKLVFTNQVRLLVQPNRIIFAETVGSKKPQDVQISHITAAYLRAFSNINYQAVSIAPSGYVPFNSNREAGAYMSENFLPSRPWKTFADRAVNAVGLKLAYPYKAGNFYLEINQANLDIGDRSIPAIWFAGNFNYQFENKDATERLAYLQTIIRQWQVDVNEFGNFISQKFLGTTKASEVSVFPVQ